MNARFSKGQKVIIESIKEPQTSPRDAGLEPFIGKCGEVADYYQLNIEGKSFYIYTVKVEDSKSEDIVVHEDEISACLN